MTPTVTVLSALQYPATALKNNDRPASASLWTPFEHVWTRAAGWRGSDHNGCWSARHGPQGIGKATAILFAKEGAKVVISDIDAKRLEGVEAEIKAVGGEVLSVAGDVGTDDFPKKIVDATVERFGKINHIVNNAGFTYDKMLHTTPDDAWDVIMKIHVRAPFRLIRQAAPYFRIKGAKENRSIINVSSTSGLHGNVGQANYAAAKSAVVGLTKTIAKEWGQFNVRANSVAFGLIHTRLTASKEAGATIEVNGKKVALGVPGAQRPEGADEKVYAGIPLRRGGTVEDAAGSVLFLASPLASYVTGHTLEVTGGVVEPPESVSVNPSFPKSNYHVFSPLHAWSFVWGASPEKYVAIVGPGLQAESGKTLVHYLETGEYVPQNTALHPERHENVKIGAATVTILLPGGNEHARRLFEHTLIERKDIHGGVIYMMPTDPEIIAHYKSEMAMFLAEASPVPTLVLLVYKDEKPSEEEVSAELGFVDRTDAATGEGEFSLAPSKFRWIIWGDRYGMAFQTARVVYALHIIDIAIHKIISNARADAPSQTAVNVDFVPISGSSGATRQAQVSIKAFSSTRLARSDSFRVICFLTFTRPAFAEPSERGCYGRRINLLLTSNSLLHRDAIAAGDDRLQMDERRKAQLDLEARIMELELELSELKRKRNALLPISQLPSELLCEILSFNNVTFANDDFWTPLSNPIPEMLHFCRVCHIWRSIVLDCPKMWSYIRVGKGTKPEFLHFLWKNTGDAQVQMNVDSSKGSERMSQGTPTAIDLVVGIIRQHPTKFYTLRVRLELDSVRTIFEGFEGSFDNMEDLLISNPKGDWGVPNSPRNDQYLTFRTPRLRRFWASGYTVPFACPLVSLPSLTDARIFQDGGSMDDLLSFFRRCASRVDHIDVGVNFPPPPGGANADPIPRGSPKTISSKQLNIESTNWRTLVAILKTIRFTSPAFGFSCREIPDENLHEFFSALALAHGGVLSPKEVRIHDDKVVLFWKDSTTHPLADGVRRILPASVEQYLNQFQTKNFIETKHKVPFADPLHYQAGWSFANLQVITILADVPSGFWTTLAHSTPLEVLRVGSHVDCYDVFDALRGLEAAGPSMPFPRLQVIVNTHGVPKNYVKSRRRRASGFPLPVSKVDFPVDLAAVLLARAGGKSTQLSLLDFRKFPEGGGLNQATLEVLLTVAKEVIWDPREWETDQAQHSCFQLKVLMECSPVMVKGEVHHPPEDDLSERRAHNAASPISILPSEILGAIFCQCSRDESQEFRDSRSLKKEVMHTYLRCSHVSHDWRAVALGTPELWSIIQVCGRTPAALVEYIYANSKNAFLSLDIEYRHQDADRFKSLTFLASVVEMERLFTNFHGKFNNLEAFTVIGGNGREDEDYLSGIAAPNLRSFNAPSLSVRLSIPLISQAPHLTHLEGSFLVDINSKTNVEPLAFLRSARNLRRLIVDDLTIFVDGRPTKTWFDTSPSVDLLNAGRPPIELPSLTFLKLERYMMADTMRAILRALCLPHAHISMCLPDLLGESPSAHRDILHDLAVSMMQDVAPREVCLLWDAINVWRECIPCPMDWVEVSRSSWQELMSGDPWVNLDFSRVDRNPPASLIADMSSHRLPLSFPELTALHIGGPLPADAWRVLAKLETLKVLRAWWGRESMRQEEAVVSLEALSGQLSPTSTEAVPFPALQVLMCVVPEHSYRTSRVIDVIGTFGEPNHGKSYDAALQQTLCSNWAFALDIRDALVQRQRVGGAPLKSLELIDCGSSILPESLTEFGGVTSEVLWDLSWSWKARANEGRNIKSAWNGSPACMLLAGSTILQECTLQSSCPARSRIVAIFTLRFAQGTCAVSPHSDPHSKSTNTGLLFRTPAYQAKLVVREHSAQLAAYLRCALFYHERGFWMRYVGRESGDPSGLCAPMAMKVSRMDLEDVRGSTQKTLGSPSFQEMWGDRRSTLSEITIRNELTIKDTEVNAQPDLTVTLPRVCIIPSHRTPLTGFLFSGRMHQAKLHISKSHTSSVSPFHREGQDLYDILEDQLFRILYVGDAVTGRKVTGLRRLQASSSIAGGGEEESRLAIDIDNAGQGSEGLGPLDLTVCRRLPDPSDQDPHSACPLLISGRPLAFCSLRQPALSSLSSPSHISLLAMGVTVEKVSPGDGKTFPKKGDHVQIHYVGTLVEGGKKFDSSRDRGVPFETEIGVGKVIKGWDEGVPQLSLGEKAILIVTHDWAYGSRGFPPVIPPNSALRFEVELLKINGQERQ
ncbi:hypothetical protein NMY22_g10834 [Coprinellus aureogranulatus]|nr:hypothetical protein NMY22_g10834 [Coprinellus aureogranulatus]